MRLVKGLARNFMSFKELEVDYENLGFCQVSGWNKDDNSASGAGKTALFDLVPFVLFGESPRNLNASDFLADFAKKDCYAHLILETDEGMLKVVRTRKVDDLYYAYLDDNGEEIKQIRGTNIRDTQKQLEELLKFNFNTFLNSIYFSRSAQSKFISANDPDKKEILTRLLDLSVYDRAYDMVGEEVKALNAELAKVTSRKQVADSRKFSLEIDIKKLMENSDSFDTNREQKIKIKMFTINDFKEKVLLNEAAVIELKSKVYVLPEFLTKLQDFSDFEKQIIGYQLQAENFQKQANEAMDVYMAEVNKIDAVKQKISETKQAVKSKMAVIDNDIRRIKNELTKIQGVEEGPCPSCKMIVNKAHLQKEIKYKESELYEKMENFTLEESNLARVLDAEAKIAQRVIVLEQMHEAVTNFNAKVRASEKAINELQLQKSQAEKDYQRSKSEHETQLNRIESQKQSDLLRIDSLEESNVSTKSQMKIIVDEIRAIKAETNEFYAMIQPKEAELAEVNEDLSVINDAIKLTNDTLEALAVLKVSYKNIKYYIFEQTIDELNRRMNKYLDPLFGEDVKVEFAYDSGEKSDKFKFNTLITKNGLEKTFNSLSDGEKCRANLACSFALSDIVALRKGSSLNMLMLDEIFDGLPAEARERVVALLEELKQERDTIMVIDHFFDTRHLVDTELLVTKENGISQVA